MSRNDASKGRVSRVDVSVDAIGIAFAIEHLAAPKTLPMPTLDLSPLLARERATGLPPGALLPAFAGLLLLRWLEVQDGERAAIAASQDEAAHPSGPQGWSGIN